MKTCKKCNLPKPIESFTVDVRYKDGRYPWCFECRKAWRDGRKDKQRQLHKDWSDQNRDHVRKKSREYFQNNDEARERNRAAGRIRDRERWHNDPAYRAKKNQWKNAKYRNDVAYKASRRAMSSAAHRRRFDNDPAYRQRKREDSAARAPLRNRYGRDARGKFTAAEWRALCAKYDHRCLCCGLQKPLSPDHIVPLSRSGANTIDNIQPLCHECNVHKFTKVMDFRPDWVGF